MKLMHKHLTTNISEFKKNPSALLTQADGETIALLCRNIPIAYIVPAKTYEKMLEITENMELLELANVRLKEKGKIIKVKFENL